MHIITMTKQHTNASSGPAPQGDGAPDVEIVTSQQAVVDAIRQSLVECYSDPYVYGPAPPETAVVRIVIGALSFLRHRSQF